MKKTVYKIIILMLSISLLISSLSVSASTKTLKIFDAPKEYTDICSKNGITLQYSGELRAVRLIDSESKEVKWNSVVTKEIFDSSESTKTWKSQLNSVLVIRYAPSEDTRGNNSLICSAEETVKVKEFLLDDGIRLDMDFTSVEISLCMEIVLTENGIEVSIPFESIEEYGKNYLLSADVFPFFGAASKESDGYILYPDGSGALSYFSKTDEKPLYTESMVLDIYGTLDTEKLLSEEENPSVMLPVYGIKSEEKAFLATITQGDYNAQICVNSAVNTSPVPINYAMFRFVFRNEYRLYLSNISSAQSDNKEQPKYGIKREKNLIDTERKIRFFLLEGENADYSGMANIYREYLLKVGKLKKSEVLNNNSLFLTVFMGARKQDTFFKGFVETCDFEDAYKIIRDYLDKGVANLQVRLRGWSNDGYGSFPQSLSPAWKLGGKKGIKSLEKLAKKEEALNLFLELNVTEALSKAGGFSKKRDVLIKGNSIPVSDVSEERFILSANKSLSLYAKAQKKLSYMKSSAFAVQSIGNTIYSNAYKKNPHTRAASAELFSGIANGNAVEGGNLYLLSSATQLSDIPLEASMHVNTDESVPFYQMVVYGSIPYSSSPGNLYYDIDEIKLKWIEYGYTPSFEITSKSTADLKETSYNQLFTAENGKWQPKIMEIYDEFSKKISVVRNAFIIKHQRIDDGVYRVAYSNGFEIYINYNTEEYSLGEIKIEAMNYVILEALK